MTTTQATQKMKRLVNRIDEIDEQLENASSPLTKQSLRSRKGFIQERLERLERNYHTAAQNV